MVWTTRIKVIALGSRNTYIGFAGNWGELVFGKNDTRFKKSEGKIDLL